MVKGIEKFRDYFSDFTDQYVLIGVAACDISFETQNVDFRATRDLDVVLIVEALTYELVKDFGNLFEMGATKIGQSHLESHNSTALTNLQKMVFL